MAIYMAALTPEEHKGRSLPSAVGCPPVQPGIQCPQRQRNMYGKFTDLIDMVAVMHYF